MKALLVAVNAKYIHSNPAVKSLYLFSKDWKDYMEIGEYTINQDMDYILGQLYQRQPDIICFSAYLWNISIIKELIVEVVKLLPDCDIWLGGPEVSFDTQEFLAENIFVRGIMRGEGEMVFRQLLQQYISGEKAFEKVHGLVYRQGKEIITTPIQELLPMDALPFLYEDLADCANRIVYYESSRGCPYGCSYCMSSVDRSVRFRSLERVLSELQYFLDKQVPQVKFLDRTFNICHERTEAILQYLFEHDNGVTNFHFEVAADILSEAEIAILQKLRPGLVQLEIGVQTTNPDTLEAICRRTNYEKLCRNVRKLQERKNVHCHLDLIAGLPLENLESFKKSFNDVYELEPEQLQLGFLKVLKGAPMQADAEKYGIAYHANAPYEVLYTDVLSYGDVLKLKGIEEMVEVYYNSGLFPNTLRCLQKIHMTAYDMYDGLWNFYRQKGYDAVRHSRISRYEILREYAGSLTNAKTLGLLEQVLLFDLYSRENLKTRPAFAMQQEAYKSAVQPVYREMSAEYRGKDYHIEWIQVNLREIKEGRLEEGKNLVLFDYSKKNPVSGMAEYRVLHSL